MKLAPLAASSDFSLGKSLLSVKEIPELSKEFGYNAAALVDTMTVSGMIPFTNACKKVEIKPIIGCRIRVSEDIADRTKDGRKRFFMPKVFVLNDEGMTDLFELLSIANTDDRFYYEARVSFDDLLTVIKRGNLAVTTGDVFSVFSSESYPDYISTLVSAQNRAQTFLELVPIRTPLYDSQNIEVLRYAKEHRDVPLIISRPMVYKTSDDAKALDALTAICSNGRMGHRFRAELWIRDLEFLSCKDLVLKAADCSAAVRKRMGESSVEEWRKAFEGVGNLIDMVEYEWKPSEVSLPAMAADENYALWDLAKAGFSKRLTKPQLGYMPDRSELPKYIDRLKSEMKTLKDMGFERYFLLVHDLVNWSKENEVIVGPGRGSVGGSLVAYLLGITDVDPLRFNLFFERFINPERLDLPDADLDFQSSRRQEVIQYLVDRYGRENVAGISNYSTLVSASALRDIARVMNLNPRDYACSKFIPSHQGTPEALEVAVTTTPEIERFSLEFPEVWDLALRVQGKMRALGKHAGGVCVAGEPIKERGVCEFRNGEMTVNWDKRVVEEQGLVKMDILGLSSLDLLSLAKRQIKENHGVDFEYVDLPLDDKKSLEAFGRGETVGVFQFESGGMRNLLKSLAEAEGLTIEEIAAANALYRPGPMQSGLMDDYIAIRQGRMEPSYDHPSMKPALEATNGVIVYQEQVMQLARDLAGFSMAGADHLRKAMGKKDREKMAKLRDQWVEGCKEHSGMSERKAGLLFDKIEKFAGYGFNKSHAIEYSIISMWSMWVKVNYPMEFYAAALTILDKEEKRKVIAQDALDLHGVELHPPAVNKSTNEFRPTIYNGKPALLMPFQMLKGASRTAAEEIMRAREEVGGEFKSFHHFYSSVQKRKCNRRVMKALDDSGALAMLNFDQETLDNHEKNYPYITLKQIPPRHPDRLRKQMKLLPGVIIEHVQHDRVMINDDLAHQQLVGLVKEVVTCDGCDLKERVHPLIRLGKKAKIMVITDCPNFHEDQNGKLMEGEASAYIRTAIKEAGLKMQDFYFTTLVKAMKIEKHLSNAQINACSGYLDREIEMLKPTVIIAMGGSVIRHLVKGVKGGFSELCGQVHYLSDIDANVILGMNPQIVYMRPEHQEDLNSVMRLAASMVS